MESLINFLRNLMYKLGLGRDAPEPGEKAPPPQPEPRLGKIEKEPLLAMKDEHLVLIVDHTFEDVPSWVEWDPERRVISITHMNGQVDEASAEIKAEFAETLKQARKLLLVSNDNDEKIVHFVTFIAR